MKIAITGGTGLLGRYLADCLNQQGDMPVVLSRQNSGIACTARIKTTDYSVPSLTKALLGVDAVAHLAAVRGNFARLEDYRVNTQITESVYEACRNNGIVNVAYASSISVYSHALPLPWTEALPPMPASVYGISKLTGEYLGDIYTQRYGFKVKNLRFAHLFGADEENDYMVNRFMRKALAKETLLLFSDSKAIREFLYAKDAAQAIVCALRAEKISGTFNIGSGEALTNREVAEYINNAFDNEGNLRLEYRDEKEMESSYMSSEKAYNGLGFKARYSFLKAMKHIYEGI